VDGKSKMSKSQGNTIRLSATPDEISDAVRQMFTDPNHVRASDPGTVEGNVVFTYLDAFDEDRTELEALKAHYRRGGLADAHVKRRLDNILQAVLAPIRERRTALARDRGYILGVLQQGTMRPQRQTQAMLDELRDALGLFRLSG
jgi:tryptophanyl-tRNA synthetase